MSEALLDVRDLSTQFHGDGAVVRAVDGVSFSIERGEVVGLVGESGCGKSVTSLSLLGLLPRPQGRITAGQVIFDGRDLRALPERELRRLRGDRVAMIFQDPMTSLNPYLRIGEQLGEVLQVHRGRSRRQALRAAVEILERVGLPDPAQRARCYPHELSGGMRQRVMIGMALLCRPELLLADEPTTALDVTVQAQILELLLELRRERSMAILLITHDLGVVAGVCDRVLVMYAGRIVEAAAVGPIFERPSHPYTRALLGSVPRVDEATRTRLEHIEGLPPRLDAGPFRACRFAPRCAFARPVCWEAEPALEEVAPGHLRRCVVPLAEMQ